MYPGMVARPTIVSDLKEKSPMEGVLIPVFPFLLCTLADERNGLGDRAEPEGPESLLSSGTGRVLVRADPLVVDVIVLCCEMGVVD